MTPLYCTIRQAIALSGTNKKRIQEWIDDGLPVYRPPGKTGLIRIADLDEYIQRYRVDKNRTREIVDSVFKEAYS